MNPGTIQCPARSTLFAPTGATPVRTSSIRPSRTINKEFSSTPLPDPSQSVAPLNTAASAYGFGAAGGAFIASAGTSGIGASRCGSPQAVSKTIRKHTLIGFIAGTSE
jgi:hypothetical protein